MSDQVKRCRRDSCTRATFVETDKGVSVRFRHGNDVHPDVYSIEQMKIYLASRGYVVVEASKILRAA